MIKRLLLILLALPAALFAGALTATSAFTDAPASVFPTIDRMTRLDMLDYFNSGSPKPSKNSFKSDCRILSASDMQMTFVSSDASEVSLSLIPQKSDTIIMVITTLKTPQDDSNAKFYTSDWKGIDKNLFSVPQLDEWVKPEAKKKKSDIEEFVPFMLARFTYEPATGTLTLTNNVAEILTRETPSWVSDALQKKLTYHWNGKKFQSN